MKVSLSIRAYTKRMRRHVHHGFHQLVLPTQGNIHIDMDGLTVKCRSETASLFARE